MSQTRRGWSLGECPHHDPLSSHLLHTHMFLRSGISPLSVNTDAPLDRVLEVPMIVSGKPISAILFFLLLAGKVRWLARPPHLQRQFVASIGQPRSWPLGSETQRLLLNSSQRSEPAAGQQQRDGH